MRRVRKIVRERDGMRCVYCQILGQVTPDGVKIEIDHIRPWALMGASAPFSNEYDLDNLCCACRTCNLRRWDPSAPTMAEKMRKPGWLESRAHAVAFARNRELPVPAGTLLTAEEVRAYNAHLANRQST